MCGQIFSGDLDFDIWKSWIQTIVKSVNVFISNLDIAKSIIIKLMMCVHAENKLTHIVWYEKASLHEMTQFVECSVHVQWACGAIAWKLGNSLDNK